MIGKRAAWRAALVMLTVGLAQAAPAVILLVRHGEPVKEAGDDPGLTAAGRQRAEALARVVAAWQAPGGKVRALFASERKRTQETLAPLGSATGLKVTVVAAKDTAALVKQVRAVKGGIVVVAGHSNTVPAIVEALSGVAGIAIADNEYDRLFAVTAAGVVELRYGAK
ncbi:MAG: phosphoglycerate mutase family protein [Candidatus Solibacter sp.]